MSGGTFCETIIIGSNLCGKKHDWQHTLGKNMTDSTSGKKHDWQHILRKKHN
jgi:hypothetical protein